MGDIILVIIKIQRPKYLIQLDQKDFYSLDHLLQEVDHTPQEINSRPKETTFCQKINQLGKENSF